MKRFRCPKDELESAVLLVTVFEMIDGNPQLYRQIHCLELPYWNKIYCVFAADRKNTDQGVNSMSKVLALVGASLGGWGGWWLGGLVGGTTAFVLSIVGTAAGVYYGRRAARQLLG